jgi:hypothetical protein
MENTLHDQALAIKGIVENVSRIEHFKHKLAIFGAPLDWAAHQRMLGQNASLLLDFFGNGSCQPRVPLVEKCSKPIEIGERRRRPIRASPRIPRPKAGCSPCVEPAHNVVVSYCRLAGLDFRPLPIEFGRFGRRQFFRCAPMGDHLREQFSYG